MSRDNDNGFDEWGGYMDAKITKLEEQFSAASDPFRKTNLFAGISIYVNGRTDPSSDELKRIMMVHGGTFHHYERAHTTYIIASHLPDVKVRNMNTSKIISAKWVVDCVAEQRILDYTHYLLYTNKRSTQPSLKFALKRKAEAVSPSPEEVESDVSSLMKELAALNAKIRESLSGGPGGSAKGNEKQQERVQAQEEDSVEKTSEVILNGNNSNSSSSSNNNSNSKSSSSSINKTSSSSSNGNNASTSSSKSSVARTAVDPKFLSEFYNNSRLHHIATLGAGFKQYVNELRQKKVDACFPARAQLRQKLMARGLCNARTKLTACVMHIDMDCFFVSVGLRKHPHLRGQPVAVTHSKGGAAATEVPVHPDSDRKAEMELFANHFEQQLHDNVLSDKVRQGFDSKMSLSEIASCSYEARAKGLRNGMFVGAALKLCPELKTIPYDFEGYREVAFTLYDTIAQYTLNIEAVSCDEMFVELTDVLNELSVTPMTFVAAVREEVREKTGCPCSAGVGANKLQARMATKRAKPDGQYELVDHDVEAYMADIDLSDLPGVGSSTAHTLREANLVKCGDLQKVSLARLQVLVGKKLGETLHQFARGIDKRPLVYGQIRKSVSAEVNYGIRFKDFAELEPFLQQLSAEVHGRLIDVQRKTKCITLKVMVRAKDAPKEASKFMGHGICDHVTKSVSLSEFTDDLETISRTVLTTMKALSLTPSELRGIGIQLTKLDEPNEASRDKQENVIKNMFEKMAEKRPIKSRTDKIIAAAEAAKVVTTSDFETKRKKEEKLMVRRTRGRPPVATSKTRNNEKDVLDMLHNAAAKRNEELATPITNSQCPPDIDPSVFAELPNDIRAELLREHKRLHVENDAVAATSTSASATATAKSSSTAAASSVSSSASASASCSASSSACTSKSSSRASSSKATASVSYELNESDLRPSTSKAAKERLERKQHPSEQQEQTTLNGVDPEFLLALPPDIRAEVESQLKAEQMLKSMDSMPPGGLDAVSAQPPDNLFADDDDAHRLSTDDNVSIDNIFAQLKCHELLLEWVQSTEAPEPYDVYLVCIHAQEFVHSKRLDELYDPLMYLCKIINSLRGEEANECAWHSAYKQIIEAVQLEMCAVYGGRRLFLGARLKCDKCCAVELS